ncbi:serine/arginine repetitive matrix protein 2-like [Penaeus chinensis]|uniref:serine/arginine repetitive matrix protein 2-like n=1 Tax=Penaeus chinensis TaxID=139456 RepID=UPI001FB60D18|nr:serine/arginine repetitive matrix protein 2-like [Penaeus chinensis]
MSLESGDLSDKSQNSCPNDKNGGYSKLTASALNCKMKPFKINIKALSRQFKAETASALSTKSKELNNSKVISKISKITTSAFSKSSKEVSSHKKDTESSKSRVSFTIRENALLKPVQLLIRQEEEGFLNSDLSYPKEANYSQLHKLRNEIEEEKELKAEIAKAHKEFSKKHIFGKNKHFTCRERYRRRRRTYSDESQTDLSSTLYEHSDANINRSTRDRGKRIPVVKDAYKDSSVKTGNGSKKNHEKESRRNAIKDRDDSDSEEKMNNEKWEVNCIDTSYYEKCLESWANGLDNEVNEREDTGSQQENSCFSLVDGINDSREKQNYEMNRDSQQESTCASVFERIKANKTDNQYQENKDTDSQKQSKCSSLLEKIQANDKLRIAYKTTLTEQEAENLTESHQISPTQQPSTSKSNPEMSYSTSHESDSQHPHGLVIYSSSGESVNRAKNIYDNILSQDIVQKRQSRSRIRRKHNRSRSSHTSNNSSSRSCDLYRKSRSKSRERIRGSLFRTRDSNSSRSTSTDTSRESPSRSRHGNRKTWSGTRYRSQETRSSSRQRSQETRFGSRQSSQETRSRSREMSREIQSRSRQRSKEARSRSRQRSQETQSTSSRETRSRSRQSRETRSRQTSRETKSRSRQTSRETHSRSRQRSREILSRSRQSSREIQSTSSRETRSRSKQRSQDNRSRSRQRSREIRSRSRQTSSETRSRSRQRSREIRSRSRQTSPETRSRSRQRSREIRSRSRQTSSETRSRSRQRSKETRSRSRQRNREIRSRSRQTSSETRSRSRQRSKETRSRSRQRSKETRSRSRQTSRETHSRSRQRNKPRDSFQVKTEEPRDSIQVKTEEQRGSIQIKTEEPRDSIQVKTDELGDTIQVKTDELGDTIQVKTDELGDTIQVKTDELGDTIQVKTDELGDTIQVKTDELGDTIQVKTDELGDTIQVKTDELGDTIQGSVTLKPYRYILVLNTCDTLRNYNIISNSREALRENPLGSGLLSIGWTLIAFDHIRTNLHDCEVASSGAPRFANRRPPSSVAKAELRHLLVLQGLDERGQVSALAWAHVLAPDVPGVEQHLFTRDRVTGARAETATDRMEHHATPAAEQTAPRDDQVAQALASKHVRNNAREEGRPRLALPQTSDIDDCFTREERPAKRPAQHEGEASPKRPKTTPADEQGVTSDYQAAQPLAANHAHEGRPRVAVSQRSLAFTDCFRKVLSFRFLDATVARRPSPEELDFLTRFCVDQRLPVLSRQ